MASLSPKIKVLHSPFLYSTFTASLGRKDRWCFLSTPLLVRKIVILRFVCRYVIVKPLISGATNSKWTKYEKFDNVRRSMFFHAGLGVKKKLRMHQLPFPPRQVVKADYGKGLCSTYILGDKLATCHYFVLHYS